jgi:ferritin-like metal-binding protein YciE
MAAEGFDEQLDKYLTDVHSIEQQALAQMKAAPDLVEDPGLAGAFAAHRVETERHELLVRERLAARGAQPALVKDLAGTLTGKGFVVFARSQPDTPGKLVAHGYSYEHMELAAYILLERISRLAGDPETAEMASTIGEQERLMGERLAGLFDVAAEAALREVKPDSLGAQLNRYLEDAHAIEEQALALLGRAPAIAGPPALAAAYEEHRSETEEHERLIAERLSARSGSPSRLKDAALRVGALNWGAFFRFQPDTPAKLAAFAFAFEHLEIASYELLRRVAARAQDGETEALAERIVVQERAAAERIRSLLEQALDASLQQLGLAA